MVTCGVCGETANPGSIFCRRCGAELPRRGVPISDAQTTVLPPIPPAAGGPPQPQEQQSQPSLPRHQAPPEHQPPTAPSYPPPAYNQPPTTARPPARGNPQYQANQPTESYAATQPPSQYRNDQQYRMDQYPTQPSYGASNRDYEPDPVFLPSDQRPPRRPNNRNGMIAAIIGGILVLVLIAFGVAIALLRNDNSKNGVAQPAPKTSTSTSAPASSSTAPSTSAKPTPTPTPTPTVNKVKVAQTAALKSLNNLVGQSGAARGGIGGAISNIGSCKSIPQSVTTLTNAANTRHNLAAQASQLDLKSIPTGSQLIASFRNAMEQSAQTDRQYALWGQQVQGCKKKAPSNPALKAAQVYDGQATAAKTDFANKYNAVAATLGLPGTSAGSF